MLEILINSIIFINISRIIIGTIKFIWPIIYENYS